MFVAPATGSTCWCRRRRSSGTTTSFNVLVSQGVSQSGAENTQTPDNDF